MKLLRMTERDVSRQITDLLRIRGWLCIRLHSELMTGRGGNPTHVGEPGIADWVAMKAISPGVARVIFIEMKSPVGRLRTSQRLWHSWAKTRGYTVAVIRSVEDLEQLLKELHFDAP